MPSVLSVKQLNLYVKSLLEGDSRLSFVSVSGEISNFKNHYSSGHLYFSLKDSDALIKCVMFRGNAVNLKFRPEDGMKVVCTGRVSLYERDGQYQYYIDSMMPAGQGDLAEQFRLIKEKLEKEGLFSPENKRPLPKFPKRIAVVTSDTGAAYRDILNIISRRYPCCEILLCPVLVQGEGAVPSMIDALERLYTLADADVIIIGRGGGSAEDLWAFNDEALARKIYESPVPVISAVGHETDFSISDFVADMRAPTPSAAAEIAVPDVNEMKQYISSNLTRIKNAVNGYINRAEADFNKCCQSVSLLKPETLIENRFIQIDRLYDRLKNASANSLNNKTQKLANISAKLDAISPLKVLSRGYAVAQANGKLIRTVDDISAGDKFRLLLSDGNAECQVIETEKN